MPCNLQIVTNSTKCHYESMTYDTNNHHVPKKAGAVKIQKILKCTVPVHNHVKMHHNRAKTERPYLNKMYFVPSSRFSQFYLKQHVRHKVIYIPILLP